MHGSSFATGLVMCSGGGEAVKGHGKRCEAVQGKARRSMRKPSSMCVVLKSTCVDIRNDVPG